MSDGFSTSDGIAAVGLEYICRVCEHETTVYVTPDTTGEIPAITHSHKLTRQTCLECNATRTFVLREWLNLDLADRPDHGRTDE